MAWEEKPKDLLNYFPTFFNFLRRFGSVCRVDHTAARLSVCRSSQGPLGSAWMPLQGSP